MQSAPFSRRALLRACVRASLVSAFALAAGLPLAAQAEEVLRVSAIPDEAPTELQRKFAPLGAYLEAETGMKVSFVPVTDYPKAEQRPHKFKMAMAIFGVTMAIALSSRIPASVALMTGVAGMLITGVLKMDEAYAAINWKTVFLMACLIPLGWAMDSSGAAAWVAAHTLDRLPQGTPTWLLEIAVGLLTTAFSLVISHVGATIVMVPVAINIALAAGGNPTSAALIVALSASNNFMTASNPVMSMIVGPAGYSAKELWRVGGLLSLIYTVVVVLMVNLLF